MHKKRHPHDRHSRHAHGGGRHRGRGPGGRGGHGGRRRVMRGDIRAAILHLLGESPMHGYQLMQEIEDRSGGLWQPSPGSIYPNLAQLTDEGLITSAQEGSKNIFSLTPDGTAMLEERTEPAPWERFAEEAGSGARGMKGAMIQLGAAAQQIRHTGTSEQREAAIDIIDNARKAMYRLLAE